MASDGRAGPPGLPTSGRGRPGPHANPPLGGFVHDIDFTRFDGRSGRLIPLGLAAVVAVIAASTGIRAALIAGLGVGGLLALAAVAFERDRWRAQDVFQWYQRGRLDRWLRDTGAASPGGDPAAAEIWLGGHRPGTVPQVYRALAAYHTGDPVVIQREVAAMPDGSILDRAWKEWLFQTNRFTQTGSAEPTELARLIGELPPSADRRIFESWLATVESARRRLAGDRRWIEPLAAERERAEPTPLGVRRRTRIWLSRFAVVIMFAIPAVLLSSLSLASADRGDPIPPEYAKTTYAIRGDLPGFGEQRVVRILPALAGALPSAVRVGAAALEEAAVEGIIDERMPTFIWTTGAIDVTGPSDAPGRHLWEVEFLLGGPGATASSVVVTLDGEKGPRYLYWIDPAVTTRLREAVGLPVGATPP